MKILRYAINDKNLILNEINTCHSEGAKATEESSKFSLIIKKMKLKYKDSSLRSE